MAEQLPMEVRLLTEDDIYRTSSQFRFWSFSPEKLAARRQTTHQLAIERIESQRRGAKNGTAEAASRSEHGEYLTEEEELRLVQRCCEQIRASSDHFKWPVSVKATAVQYLRRFYLSNSVMTYPPKEIYKTALFLACKTEATHMTLSEYARRISAKPEEVLAPEYKLMQALRFTLDVRQPFRGLKGVLMELLNMVEGMPEERLHDEMMGLGGPSDNSASAWRAFTPKRMEAKDLRDRVQAAYSAARSVLDGPALMTDVYFLYTPAQILHAAMYWADSVLAGFYLSTKLPTDSSVRPKILATIQACADMMASSSASSNLTKDHRAALEQKLERCRDPSTRDLVKTHLAKKSGDGAEDGEKAKRRKLDRERSAKEGDDLFGPGLPVLNGKSRDAS